jgi:two-component system CheB/CheR fusion protein
VTNSHAVPVEIRARSIRFDGTDAILLNVRDVSERQKARQILEKLHKRARSILNLMPDAVLTTDAEGNIESVNQAAESMTGYPASELPGRSIEQFISKTHFDRRSSGREDLALRLGVDDGLAHEMTLRNSEGSTTPVEVIARTMKDIEDDHLIVVVRDISVRRDLERDVLRISEEERQRIGQDIHDHLASKFSGLALMARGLLNKVQNEPGYSVDSEMLDYIIRQARVGAEEARTLARGLNPVKMEERGLEAALQELTHDVETMSEASCDLTFGVDIPDLESSTASQLYRIAYEAVTNAMKHAEAEHIRISVRNSNETISLAVEDDGKGMPEGEARSNGMGIHIMKYRAGIIHASIGIDSAPDRGTTVTCRMPV